jgi:hypothetical protein
MEQSEFQAYLDALFVNRQARRDTECWQLRRIAWFVAEETLIKGRPSVGIDAIAVAIYGEDTRSSRGNVYRSLSRIRDQLARHQRASPPTSERPHVRLERVPRAAAGHRTASGRLAGGLRLALTPGIDLRRGAVAVESAALPGAPTIIPDDLHAQSQLVFERAIKVVTSELTRRGMLRPGVVVPTTELTTRLALDLLFDPEADFLSRRMKYFYPLTRVRLEMRKGRAVSFRVDALNEMANAFYGVHPDSRELFGVLREQLFERVQSWMDERNFEALYADQQKTLREYERRHHATATVPVRFNRAHPNPRFRGSHYGFRILSTQIERVDAETEVHKAIVAYID